MINNVYSLPELDFVGGSSEDLVFHVYCDKTNQKPFGLTGCTANFSIINFVNKNGAPVVSKTMTVRMDESETFYNILFVSLQPDDTVDLFGKFVYQITIKDIDNNVDIPQQGVIYIHNNINKEFVRR